MSEQTQTETQTQTPPSVTIDDKKYLCSDLSDRANLILSDLTRTVLEYKELMRNYNQSLTLTNTYASGLKNEVEKVELPEATDDTTASIKIEDKSYDGTDLPDSVKAYVSELVRANQTKTSFEFRLRQLDAARLTYISSLKNIIEESDIEPVE